MSREFDKSVGLELRTQIEEREARVTAWRRSLPKRKKPTHEKPGPVLRTIIGPTI